MPPAVQRDLDAALDDFLASADLPGLAAAVITDDGWWAGASGAVGPDDETPLASDAAFAIASITKTFIAALVLREVEQGAIDLDARLSDYLAPALRALSGTATVRQALSHRSGITEYLNRAVFDEVFSECTRTWSAEEVAALIPPPIAPGVFRYSNSNYILLGSALERATGSRLGELVRQLVDPLELRRIVYQPDEPATGPFAYPHVDRDGDGQWDRLGGTSVLPCESLATLAGPAGGMASDAASLARWGWLLYGGNVLSHGSLIEMTTSVYGLGTVPYDLGGLKGYGHDGGIPGYATSLVVFPGAQIAMVVFVNADRPEVLRTLAARIIELVRE